MVGIEAGCQTHTQFSMACLANRFPKALAYIFKSLTHVMRRAAVLTVQ